jgi:hypothetical protein
MKLIGIKRLIILAALLGVNVVIAMLYFLWVDPMVGDAQSKLSAVNGQISSLQGNIRSVKSNLAEFKRNLPKYEAFKSSGFMGEQDRFKASHVLDDLRVKAGLGGFSFNINDVEEISNQEASAAKMKIIRSKIDVKDFSFLLDNNFYGFLDLLHQQFPEEAIFRQFEIVRKDPLDAAALQKISVGQAPQLLTASASFSWITIVPQTEKDANKVRGR